MSPIKGVTNFYRPQRSGKIHLGVKNKKPSKDGKGTVEYPSEVDYFVLKDAPELIPFYEEKPTLLNVMLPSSRFEKSFDEYLEKVFPQYLKRYRASGLICKGDGSTAVCVNEKTGSLDEQPCPCEYLEKGECKRIGILRVRIQEIPTFNVFQLTTSSFNSIVNVNSFVRDLAEFCAVNRVDISSVKLVLKRGEQTVQRMENGKVSKSKHWIMTMDLDPRFYKSLGEVAVKALPQSVAKPKALPPPDESRDDLFFGQTPDEIEVEDEDQGIGDETDRRLGATDQDIANPDVKEAGSFGEEIGSTFAKEKKAEPEDVKSDKYVAERQVLAEKLMSLTAEYRALGGKINQKTWDRIMGMMSMHDYEVAVKFYEAAIQKMAEQSKKEAPKSKQGKLP